MTHQAGAQKQLGDNLDEPINSLIIIGGCTKAAREPTEDLDNHVVTGSNPGGHVCILGLNWGTVGASTAFGPLGCRCPEWSVSCLSLVKLAPLLAQLSWASQTARKAEYSESGAVLVQACLGRISEQPQKAPSTCPALFSPRNISTPPRLELGNRAALARPGAVGLRSPAGLLPKEYRFESMRCDALLEHQSRYIAEMIRSMDPKYRKNKN